MKNYQNIYNSAVKYLAKGFKKNFIIHTKGVVKAMELILKKEKGDPDILMPAAILHDVGWAKVPKKYQATDNKADKLRGMKLHLELAPAIIKKILKPLNYKASKIKEITEIIQAHKFKKPRNLSQRLLIDADQLADSFKEQFYSDVKSYKSTPERIYNFRIKDNNFYTKTAKDIFLKEMKRRKNEFENV